MNVTSISDMLRLLSKEIKEKANEALSQNNLDVDRDFTDAWQNLEDAIDYLNGQKPENKRMIAHAWLDGVRYSKWYEAKTGYRSLLNSERLLVRVFGELSDGTTLITHQSIRLGVPHEFLTRVEINNVTGQAE